MSDISKINDDVLISLEGTDIAAELRNRGYRYGWYKKSDYCSLSEQSVAGLIYIIVGSLHTYSVKIGFTENISEELQLLDSCSDNHEKHHCYAIFRVYSKVLDSDISSLFSSFLPSSDSGSLYHENWFNLSKDKAYSILQDIARIFHQSDNLVLNPLQDSYFKSQSMFSNSVIIIGQRVRHVDFGSGEVKAISSDKNGPTYTVRFDDGQTRVLNSFTFEDGHAVKI